MGKIVDITERLNFEGNPKLKVKDTFLEINADAPTVLKIMGIMNTGEQNEMDGVLKAYELLFTEEAKKHIEELKLGFKDLMILIENAISLVTGAKEASVGE